MTGFQRICKLYGSIVVQGKTYLWDYANDKAVPESEMPKNSERYKASEKAKWAAIKKITAEKQD